jgi:hypothetical protein
MRVEFFFEQFVDRGVQGEGISWRLAHAHSAIQIKTTGAIQKQIYLGTADPEWLFRLGVEKVFASIRIVVFGHIG